VYESDYDEAVGQALYDASARLTEVLIRRYERMVPVVEVLAGRSGVAVFSSQAEVAVMEDDSAGLVSASLD
jgi:hypothetical protein